MVFDHDDPINKPDWINSKAHDYSFIKYCRDHSRPCGEMKEHTQSQIAKLLNIGEGKVQSLGVEATVALKEELQFMGLSPTLLGIEEDEVDKYGESDEITSDSDFGSLDVDSHFDPDPILE